jgi:hypothetical protein
MTISLSSISQQVACNAVVDQLDSLPGTLRLLAGAVTLCDLTLPAPAFGASNISGTAQALGLPLTGNAVGSGTANAYQVLANGGAVLWTGAITLTGQGGDIQVDNPNIQAGQGLAVTSWAHTQPAT